MNVNAQKSESLALEKKPSVRVDVSSELHNPLQLRLFDDHPQVVPLFLPLDQDVEEFALLDGELSVTRTDHLSHILVAGFGIFLGKKSERLVVRKGSKALYEFPLFRISEILVASPGISVSTDLISEACKRGIRMSFLSSNGMPIALLTSPLLTAVVDQRREQMLAYNDGRAVVFAREVARGKITNQRRLLQYFGKYLKKKDPERFSKLETIALQLGQLSRRAAAVSGTTIDESRGELLGIEGAAGRLYWDAVKMILADAEDFAGRQHRGAGDVVNAALNYGYGILYTQVWGALMNASLEPFAGFLHVDRPGKASLVLDLVEEFRQPIVDRTVLSMINLKVPLEMANGLLNAKSREQVAKRVLDQLDSDVKFHGKEYKFRSIIQMQARNLAAFLRGNRPYKAFLFRY